MFLVGFTIVLYVVNIIYEFDMEEYDTNKQWYLEENAVDVINAWHSKNVGEKEVIIAVIDTGVDYKHELLKKHMWTNISEIPNDGIDNDNNGYVDDIIGWNFVENTNDVLTGTEYFENDHGTECASIIASGDLKSEFKGINYSESIKIMSLKILSGIEKSGDVNNLIEAIKYAENNGADICNLSVNFDGYNAELSELIKHSEMTFIVSAGNDALDIDRESVYLGSYNYNNVISVAAVDRYGELYQESNYGKNSVDIAAPGVEIYCAVVNGYDYDTGTSMATAIVTGVCAMIISTNNTDDMCDLKNVLMETSYKRETLENVVQCSGIVNANNAINSVNYK